MPNWPRGSVYIAFTDGGEELICFPPTFWWAGWEEGIRCFDRLHGGEQGETELCD
jgi:hypothetical protein